MGSSDSPTFEPFAAAAAVLDAVPACIAWLDADATILGVNAGWRQFMAEHGRADEAAPGRNYLQLRERLEAEQQVDAPRLSRLVRDVMAGRARHAVAEHRSVFPATERWFRVTVIPLPVHGRLGAVLTFVELTEERAARAAIARSEAELRRTTEQLEHIIDASHDVICAFDREGRFLQVSAACTALWGYEPAELVGRRYVDFVFPDDRAATLAAGERVLAGEPVRHFEHRWLRKDGGVSFVLWSCQWSLAMEAAFGVARDVSEARLSAEAGRLLDERLRDMLDNMSDAFITLDRHWRITFVNKAAGRLTRRNAADLLGSCLWDEFPEARNSRFGTEYRRAVETGKPVEFEENFQPLGLWLEVRALPGRDGLAVYLRDITERYRVRAALIESEERFKYVANATNDAIWDWDIQRNTVWWNEGVLKLFGVTPAEAMTPNWWDSRLHPEDRDRVVAGLNLSVLGPDTHWSGEYRFRRVDGGYSQVRDRAFIMRDADGRAVRMVGGMSDVTAQREFEDRLREKSALLDSARDAIHLRDLSHRILYWNRSAEILYGWSSEEALGCTARELFQVEPGAFAAAYEQMMRTGEYVGDLEKRRKDGRSLLIEARWTLLRDGQGKPSRVLVIEADVTERRFLERQLMRSQRMDSLGTLAGGIAHDLNNVFTPILMSASLLANPRLGPEEQELVSAVCRSAQRGADMVRQLVSFARGAEGRHEAVDPARIVVDAAKMASDTFPKDIRVELEVDDALSEVTGDATQLHQVLVNLCVNARDSMPAGGRIAVRARNEVLAAPMRVLHGELPPGPYVVLEVEDTGCGISRENLDKIFEPFFTTKEPGRGSGLGLATSLAILRSHRGSMHVESRVGEGSRFRALVPAATSPRAAAARAADEPMPRGDGHVVLVVDDEHEILEAARRALTAHGYRVIVAHDGSEALARFAPLAGTVDVAVVDMMMPGMNGADTIERLRRLDPELRIVSSSGYATKEQGAKVAAAGVGGFLPKPYAVSALLQAIATVLRAAA